ncbi:erythroid differentiation-related factor 1 [Contarinia nasturtii]|uniref:erythroid differentiation-related factor 1 n=1 Tax=Contarinia nasturtii TaxID=265458 RepID=UPI0012D400E4|nr:erythroid differentiation-related factor 1 [Contarinia nasturtii]
MTEAQLKISECINSHDEGTITSITSTTTLKHQMVRSPANFARLKCNTDLNVPPSNWLSSSFNSYGLQQALSQATGFSSFRMAHLFPDCLSEVDVVTNAENIKRLLKLPYDASNCAISMMVHRIGNTLLIDDFDVHRFLLQQEDGIYWKWLKSFICEHFMTRLNEQERNVLNKQSTFNESKHQRSLLSKFLYHSLKEVTTSDSEDALNMDIGPDFTKNERLLLPEPNVEDVFPDPKHTKHTYNRNVIWQLNNTKMLIGTDVPIFGTGPCISLRLRDMRQPINVLTGIDYWLDNLMCNVPEILMCYHLNGLVQKYEIIKTEDLPFIDNSQFSPTIIRNVAQNILSFLKQNATQPGHTYWLFKSKKDDIVKLYDLTSLCTCDGEFSPQSENDKQNDKHKKSDEDQQSPFTIPVACVLYKVAKNMKNSKDRIEAKQAGSIKALLENCIKLLPKEQYPQIVTSSFYLLSDLQIPAGTDPISPKFINEVDSESESIYDDFDSNSSEGDEMSANDVLENTVIDTNTEASIHKKRSENHFPPPLTGNIDERCTHALESILNGLNCLQYFSISEESEKEEIEKQAEKMRIIQEEQNPNMAKRNQAIPLPYEELQSTTEKKNLERKKLPIIDDWNTHLKLLLIEKSCLVYAILTEQEYQESCYGSALKYISIATKCYEIVSKQASNYLSNFIEDNYRTNLFSRRGDCYFLMAQNINKIESYVDQYKNMKRDVDLKIEKELQKDFTSLNTHTLDDVELPTNIEQLILLSIKSYEMALRYANGKESRFEILGRIGSVKNELGVKYMHWSQEEYEKKYRSQAQSANNLSGGFDDNDKQQTPELMYVKLAKKSYECFVAGISLFEEIKDDANLCILLCNMGRFMRFRAHIEDNDNFGFKKICYERAFCWYQRGLTILESKKHSPHLSSLWDLLTYELSSGKFTLAKLMQDNFRTKMDEVTKHEIIETLMGSLKLCDTQACNSRQQIYMIRTGQIYANLANIYAEEYKCADNARRKKLINLCNLYYEKSVKVFKNIDAFAEFLEVQINRMEFQNTLFEGSHTASQKCKCLHTSLKIAFENIDDFMKMDKFDNNINLLKQFESMLQRSLRILVQSAIQKYSDATRLKQVYSFSLQSHINRNDFNAFRLHIANTLNQIQANFQFI